MKSITKLVILIVFGIVLCSCNSVNKRAVNKQKNEEYECCIPKDMVEARMNLRTQLPLEIQFKIITNDLDNPGFRELISWYADKWKTTEQDITNVFKKFKAHERGEAPDKDYEYVSYYDRTNYFAHHKYYLTYKFSPNEIPRLDKININFNKMPVIRIHIDEDDLGLSGMFMYYGGLDNPDPDKIIKGICKDYRISRKSFFTLNNLEKSEDILKRKKLLFPRLEYPPIYDFIEKSKEE